MRDSGGRNLKLPRPPSGPARLLLLACRDTEVARPPVPRHPIPTSTDLSSDTARRLLRPEVRVSEAEDWEVVFVSVRECPYILLRSRPESRVTLGSRSPWPGRSRLELDSEVFLIRASNEKMILLQSRSPPVS